MEREALTRDLHYILDSHSVNLKVTVALSQCTSSSGSDFSPRIMQNQYARDFTNLKTTCVQTVTDVINSLSSQEYRVLVFLILAKVPRLGISFKNKRFGYYSCLFRSVRRSPATDPGQIVRCKLRSEGRAHQGCDLGAQTNVYFVVIKH